MQNCKNCGAPLHGYRCDYCGTEYEKPKSNDLFVRVFKPEPITLAVKSAFTRDEIEYMEDMERIKKDIAMKMSRELVKYMDVETWVDPGQLFQVFGASIRVLPPGHYNE